MEWKKELRFPWLRALMLIAVSCIVGLVLLTGVFTHGGGRAMKHARESMPVFEAEGQFYRLYENSASWVDNFTDALMINIAANISGDETYSPLQRALNPYMIVTPDGNCFEETLLYFSDPFGDHGLTPRFYGRYWHGYLVVLRPLLMFFNLSEIRQINMLCQFALLGAALLTARRRVGLRGALALLLVWLCLNPTIIAWSLTLSTCYYLSMLGAIAVCLLPQGRDGRQELLFVLLGILTSFCDFSTYPIVVLGLPLLLCLMRMQKNEGMHPARLPCAVVRLSFAWAMGFLGMWMSKWLLLAVSGNWDALAEAFYSLTVRTSSTIHDAIPISRLEIVLLNYRVYGAFRWLALAPAAAAAVLLLCDLRKRRTKPAVWAWHASAYLMTALIAAAWIFVTANHAQIHNALTYRDLSVLFAGVFAAFACGCASRQHLLFRLDKSESRDYDRA